jgi:hypothetical protein
MQQACNLHRKRKKKERAIKKQQPQGQHPRRISTLLEPMGNYHCEIVRPTIREQPRKTYTDMVHEDVKHNCPILSSMLF